MSLFLPFNFNPKSISVRDEGDANYTVGTTVADVDYALVQVSCGLDGTFSIDTEVVIDRTITNRDSTAGTNSCFFSVGSTKVFRGSGMVSSACSGRTGCLEVGGVPVIIANDAESHNVVYAGNSHVLCSKCSGSLGSVTIAVAGYELSEETPYATFWVPTGTVLDCDVNCEMVISEYELSS